MKVFAVALVCVVAMATVEGLYVRGPFIRPHLFPGMFHRVPFFPRPMLGHGIGGVFPEPGYGALAEPGFGARAEPGFGAHAEPGFGAHAEPGVGVPEPFGAVPEYY